MKRRHLYVLTAAISLSAILAACGDQNSNSSGTAIEQATYTIDEAQKQVAKIMNDMSNDATVLSDKLINVELDSPFLQLEMDAAYSLGENGEVEKLYNGGLIGFDSFFKYIKGEEPTLVNGDKPTVEEKESISENVNNFAIKIKEGSILNEYVDLEFSTEDNLISSEEKDGVYTFVYDGNSALEGEEESIKGTFTVKMDKSLNVISWENEIVDVDGTLLAHTKLTFSDYKW